MTPEKVTQGADGAAPVKIGRAEGPQGPQGEVGWNKAGAEIGGGLYEYILSGPRFKPNAVQAYLAQVMADGSGWSD